jgi:hypothetical protein
MVTYSSPRPANHLSKVYRCGLNAKAASFGVRCFYCAAYNDVTVQGRYLSYCTGEIVGFHSPQRGRAITTL